MTWSGKLLCLLTCVGAVLAQFESMVVHLEGQGAVRGYKDEQGDIYSFLDVPYATAPTGIHKYKAPLEPPVWNETFEAVAKNIVCQQSLPDYLVGAFVPQDDCLVANIYVPDTNTSNLPVLVDVHGGAYQMGAAFFIKYTNLARSKQVIVVTFNYRLGVQGFLCLGTEDVPGNAGMKDQVALLRWVKKHIASFKGNPDDVTISGCSAGGGSVDFLTISPMTAGLFNKAITGSGAVFGATGAQTDPVQNAKIYAQQLNFTNVNDFGALENFYKTASYDVLLSEGDFVMEYSKNNQLLFAPCVERETGNERFLHETPLKILKVGNYQKVPLLYGYAEMEGLFRLPESSRWIVEMNNKFSDFLPGDLHFESNEEKEQVATSVKSIYFGNQSVSEDTTLTYINYFTDIMFAYPMLRGVNIRRASLGDTIYLYMYSFVDENTPSIPNTNVRGPGHCDQTFAVTDAEATTDTEEYKMMVDTMIKLWLDFIITGNPTPEGSSLPPWPPVNGLWSPFMSLKSQSQVEQSWLSKERMHFWDSIYEKHYVEPLAPNLSSRNQITLSATVFSILIKVFY